MVQLLRLNNDEKERALVISSAMPTRDSFTLQPQQTLQTGDPTLVGATLMEEKKTMAVKGFFKKGNIDSVEAHCLSDLPS